MGKRLFDIIVAGVLLAAAAPLLLVAALGIKLTSRGPILYPARRIGLDRRRPRASSALGVSLRERRQAGYQGREFTMYKFRSMQNVSVAVSTPITAVNDSRVFPFGAWLRATKIDELPQLVNVLKGDMTLVGPRPEAPEIVRSYYTKDDLTTLQVRPGVTSPGTIYYYTHGEAMLVGDKVLELYLRDLLRVKLALDRVYIKRATLLYDIQLIVRTVSVIAARVFGSHRFADPPELKEAVSLLPR